MRSTIAAPATPPRRSGFSLVDMAVLISLVGIAACFSVPRYTRLANHARAIEVVALSGTLRTAAAAAHQQYLASGGTLGTATLRGAPMILKNGYPDASSGGISIAVLDWGGLTAQATPGIVIFLKTGAPLAAQCSVTYQAALAADSTASVTHVETSGC